MNWDNLDLEKYDVSDSGMKRAGDPSRMKAKAKHSIEIQPVEYELSPRAKQVMENALISLDASGQPIVTYHSA